MRIINTAFNVSLAREMAKRGSSESPEENSGNALPCSTRKQGTPIEPKASIAARSAFSMAIHEHIDNIRNN